MTEQQWVDPASCPPHKHYTGIVRTSGGLHQRILRRSQGYQSRPWEYQRNPEEGGPLVAADHEVSDLQELDPFVNDQLRRSVGDVNKLQRELDAAERTIHTIRAGIALTPEPLDEKRVRELAREEINKTSWQLNGLTITHKHVARDREDHNL